MFGRNGLSAFVGMIMHMIVPLMRNMRVVAAMHRHFAQITLTADAKPRDQALIGFLLTFRALTKVFGLRRVEVGRKIVKDELAAPTFEFKQRHPKFSVT